MPDDQTKTAGPMTGPLAVIEKVPPTVRYAIGAASVAAGAYHGYRRTGSYGWALLWAFFAGVLPIIAIPIAVAQGFGEREKGGKGK